MMGDRLEELRNQKRELSEAYAEAGRELKRAKQQQRDRKKKEARAWVLSPVELNTMLIIYGLTDYTAAPAARFLWSCGRKHRWSEKTWEQLDAMAEEHFLKVDVVELADLTDMDDPSDVEAMKLALVFVEEWKLARWTTDLNVQHGVAPSTESVLQRYESQRVAVPETVRPRYRGTAQDVASRVWASAWRGRWGGKHARVRVREDIPLTELRSKVGSRNSAPLGHQNLYRRGRKALPVLVSENVPIFGCEPWAGWGARIRVCILIYI